MEYEELFQKLQVNGVRTYDAKERFLGDRTFYVEMMSKFLEENEIQKAIECVQMEDYEKAKNHAFELHSLTGAFGIINAYEASTNLCSYLNENRYEKVKEELEVIKSNLFVLHGIFQEVLI